MSRARSALALIDGGRRGSYARSHVERALALPLAERISLAQARWESIGEGLGTERGDEENEAIALAGRRDAELTAGNVAGRSREQVNARGAST